MIDKELIKDVPSSPGVYLWKDKNGKVIYVGKAKNLKNRMSQYFDKKMINSYKTPKMLEKIASFSTIVLSSDREAFIQERKLIDFYRPFYNVLFPSQSSFPYIRVKLSSDFKLSIEIKNNYHKEKNAIYYGPLPNNKNFKPLLRYLNHLLLSEDGLINKNQSKEFAIKKFEEAKEIMRFGLKFKKELDNKISEAIDSNLFEAAKFYNDILDLLNYNQQEQQIFIKNQKSIDVFGFYEINEMMLIHVMFYRGGSLINQQDFILEIKTSLNNFYEEFFNEFYANNNLPDIIASNIENEILNDINQNLELFIQNNEQHKSLIDFAYENAKNNHKNKIEDFNNRMKRTSIAQQNLSTYLNTNTDRIVLFDNSFLKGTKEVIGGAAYFKEGLPVKKFYRYYNLDDSLLRHADVEYMRQTSYEYLKEFSNDIDVILADGSLQQINEIIKSMNVLSIDIPIFGLIKDERHETHSVIDRFGNVIFIDDSDVFDLLSRMQTEVDRFVKNKYNKKQTKTIFNNPLLKIDGLGEKTLKKLLDYFESYKNINLASEDELRNVVGDKLAKKIIENRI
ncbi:GIY-YIG nuclease family protein [Metamycoplasma spumans]|uniref:GIY-YIG nuclease family protein n=1 Tax=Metamycoplasma spumans TaxID=92406 RepID=UPI0034DDB8F7